MWTLPLMLHGFLLETLVERTIVWIAAARLEEAHGEIDLGRPISNPRTAIAFLAAEAAAGAFPPPSPNDPDWIHDNVVVHVLQRGIADELGVPEREPVPYARMARAVLFGEDER